MKIKIIHNPYSSRWVSHKRRPVAEEALINAGADFEWVPTTAPGEAIDLAAQAVEQGYETIVAAGGDGTVGEVVNGIMRGAGENPPPNLGILPMGTANDLVHNLKLPLDLAEAAQVIAAGKTRKMDLCQVNDRFFANNAGLGLEPFTTTIQERMKRVHGITRYLLATLLSIAKNPQWEMSLEWDDGQYQGPVTMVSISNGAVTGGIFYTVPHADPFDGKLSFAYGYIGSRLKIMTLLPRIMKPDEGNYVEHPSVHEIHATWLKVHLEPGSPAHTDGELFSRDIKQASYRVFPAKLPVLMDE
ncbi:diacylglycerol/lipid kinase family protein [Chloroflexota bacterium]